jgi:DNA-binding XRE family transcriptional regulator
VNRISALSGDALTDLRRRSGLPAKDLAAVLGICRESFYKWEVGAFKSHNSLAALAARFLIELDDARLAVVAKELRYRLTSGDVLRARSWLYSLVTR